MEETAPRPASGPVAGATRAAVAVSLAQVLMHFVSQVVPVEILPQVDFLLTGVVTAAFVYVGKVARDRGWIVGTVV